MDYYIDTYGDLKDIVDLNTDNIYSSSYSLPNSDFHSIEIPSDKQREINYSTFKEIADFYNKNESSFKKAILKSEVDIWFLEQFRLYFNYRNFHLKIECISQFLSKYPKGIIISSDQKIKSYFPSENVNIIDQSISIKKASKKRLIQEFIFIIKQFRFKKLDSSKSLLISRIEDIKDNHDQRLGVLEASNSILLNREQFKLSSSLLTTSKFYRNNNNVDQITARYLINPIWVRHINKFNKSLSTLFNELTDKKDLKSIIITDWLKSNRMSYIAYYIRFKGFDKFFKKSNYKTVLFINENSAQQKVIQYAAKKHNVKTMAVQHGTIYDLHPAYIFKHYKSKPILPDITFTWGEFFTKKLIKEGSYKANQVITTGKLPPLIETRFLNTKISKTKQKIVYATQPQPDPKQRIKELKDVYFAAMQLINKYQLIIRPHPNEKDDAYFLNAAKEIGLADFLIDRDSDLKSHFEICDILITSYSTVGAEFIPYYKPLLVLDYLQNDLVGYIKEGVGIAIYSVNQLVDILENDKLIVKQEKYDEFVKNYFYELGEKSIEIINKTTKLNSVS